MKKCSFIDTVNLKKDDPEKQAENKMLN